MTHHTRKNNPHSDRYVYGLSYANLCPTNEGSEKTGGLNMLSMKTSWCYDNKDALDFEEFRNQFYNDPAVFLTKPEIQSTNFYKKPIYDEHDPSRTVGFVIEAWQSKHATRENQVMTLAKIVDPKVIEKIDSGYYKGFSFGYNVQLAKVPGTGSWFVEGKEINEISICRDPFYEPCQIYVAASKETKKKNERSTWVSTNKADSTTTPDRKKVTFGKTVTMSASTGNNNTSTEGNSQSNGGGGGNTNIPPTKPRPALKNNNNTQKPSGKQPTSQQQQQQQQTDEMDTDVAGELNEHFREVSEELEQNKAELDKVKRAKKSLEEDYEAMKKERAMNNKPIQEFMEYCWDNGNNLEEGQERDGDWSKYAFDVASERSMGDHQNAWKFAMAEHERLQKEVDEAKEFGKENKTLKAELEKVQKTNQKLRSRNGKEPNLEDLFDLSETTTIKGIPLGKKSNQQKSTSTKVGVPGGKKNETMPETIQASKQTRWRKSTTTPTPTEETVEPQEEENQNDDDDDDNEDGEERGSGKKRKYDFKSSKNREHNNQEDWRVASRKRIRTCEQEMADKRGVGLETDKSRNAVLAQLSKTPEKVPLWNKASFKDMNVLEDRQSETLAGLGARPLNTTTFKPEELPAKRARWMKTSGDGRRV